MLCQRPNAAIGNRIGSMPIGRRSWLCSRPRPDITIDELRHSLSKKGLYALAMARPAAPSSITRSRAVPCRRARPSGRFEGPRGLRESQDKVDRDRLVFICETWASTNMARTHGRFRRGERLRASIPHGHWKTTTCVAALARYGIIGPWVLDGPTNRDVFECQSALEWAPHRRPKGPLLSACSAGNALASSELVGVAETARARMARRSPRGIG